ncbi:hypothetical protein pb186bvf_006307 [Paramecium bursaria]
MKQQKKAPIVINLYKVAGGFVVEQEKKETTFKIPLSVTLPTAPIQKKDPIPPQKSFITPPQIPVQQYQQPPPQFFYQQQFQKPVVQQQPTPPQQIQAPTPPPPPVVVLPPQPEILPPSEPPKRPSQKHQLIVPSCSIWFNIDNIHNLEKEAFPDFFQSNKSSKTPELYKKYRNFMVNLYRAQPNVYLSTTACRKVLAGDACSIARIHGFLQHWGIINFNVDPDTCPGRILPAPNINLYRQLSINAKDELDDMGDLSSQEMNTLNIVKVFSKKYRPLCDFCGIQCGLVWYQQKPIKDIKELTLCVKCYANNSFPNILSPEDFDRNDIEQKLKNIDILNTQGQSHLTDQEICTILLFLQDNPDAQWDQIQQHLNKQHNSQHSEEQVIQHFLTYPLGKFSSIDQLWESKENLDSLGIQDLAYRIGIQDPIMYSDYSSIISFHLALFRRLLNKYCKKEEVEINVVKQENNNHKQEESNHVGEDKFDKLKQLTPNEIGKVMIMKTESLERAKQLQEKEEQKLNDHVNLLIHLQMDKLEMKLSYLEEYEKLIIYERSQLEQSQKYSLAERMKIVQQRLQLFQEQNL